MATIEQAFVIVEPYKLQEKIIFDKSDMHWLFQMKQAVHDNINTFVGVCVDRGSDFYVIWKHCLRGTLSDVIKNSGVGSHPTFDRDFKGAFVRDIVKVWIISVRLMFVFRVLISFTRLRLAIMEA